MNDVQKKLFRTLVEKWSFPYTKPSSNLTAFETNRSLQIRKKSGRTIIERKYHAGLTERIQTHVSPEAIVNAIELISTNNIYNELEKRYFVIVQEAGIYYGGKVVMDNEYSFRYYQGMYHDFHFYEMFPSAEWKKRFTDLQLITEQALQELPEYRLYAATGMLTFY